MWQLSRHVGLSFLTARDGSSCCKCEQDLAHLEASDGSGHCTGHLWCTAETRGAQLLL